jgi:type I restriction enzyme R subunit
MARLELRGIMQYRQKSTLSGWQTPATSTTDGGVIDAERKVVIAGADEAMLYRRRLKSILDEMLNANPILQKIYQGLPIATVELDSLTSTILTAHQGEHPSAE